MLLVDYVAVFRTGVCAISAAPCIVDYRRVFSPWWCKADISSTCTSVCRVQRSVAGHADYSWSTQWRLEVYSYMAVYTYFSLPHFWLLLVSTVARIVVDIAAALSRLVSDGRPATSLSGGQTVVNVTRRLVYATHQPLCSLTTSYQITRPSARPTGASSPRNYPGIYSIKVRFFHSKLTSR